MSSNNQHPKRAWKLQEFVAHGATVNCLALGHKSGRVLVTGGDDKKVNLWAVGKPNCIMSLSGHTTAVECVKFGHTEELVCAGSASGALKIWDLEAARLVRTLTGHKSGIKCIDFHPYGDFLSSGSSDTNLKLWDIRRKGCIFTYKGHSQQVNSLKFSPDGQWVASAGEEGAVKIWDLRAGKLMTELTNHGGPVHDVEFHPHEFLLASGSQDRTVNFWDLETFNLVSSAEKDSGPIRCITFHPEGNCLFTGSHDSLRVHGWEPPKVHDMLVMGWGKIRDMAIASTQLVGAAVQSSNVSLYIVDLKRVQPFGYARMPGHVPVPGSGGIVTVVNTGGNGTEFRTGQHVRRSFIKEKPDQNGMRPRPDVKISEDASSDKSGTDPEDSSDNFSQADITDYQNYEQIFRPRMRELNRTPPLPPYLEFQAPDGSDVEVQQTIPHQRPNELRLRTKSKKPSPSPTRRQSQPALPPGYTGSPVRVRRGSNPPTPTSTVPPSANAPGRPVSVYETSSTGDPGRPPIPGNGAVSPPARYSYPPSIRRRAWSVQARPVPTTIYQHQPQIQPEIRKTENIIYLQLRGFGPDILDHLSPLSNRSQSLTRPIQTKTPEITPLTPVSRIQITQQQLQQIPGNDRPLERPTLVRPQRTSSVLIQPQQHYDDSDILSSEDLYRRQNSPPVSEMRMARYGSQNMIADQLSQNQVNYQQTQQQQQRRLVGPPLQQRKTSQQQNITIPNFAPPTNNGDVSPNPDKSDIIPMNMDKPSGLPVNDFLPRKFQNLNLGNQSPSTEIPSKFSQYKSYCQQPSELSEAEVTSSILKGHDSMMAVLANRGRQLEIVHKLWQSKDAKTAVDHSVSLNDQSVVVDLLSVITLRPSIWNLDLCVSLLPSIGELMQSKYEAYISVGCNAMKLILKNFASVIKSNIDSPVQTVGVDISREERHNKCMQCYKDLVKIRSLILKRQTIQGKLGHVFRELSILMQYLD